MLSKRHFRLAAGRLAWRFAAICHPHGDFRRGFHLVRLANATADGVSDSDFSGRNCDRSAVQRLDNRMERTLCRARHVGVLGRPDLSSSERDVRVQ